MFRTCGHKFGSRNQEASCQIHRQNSMNKEVDGSVMNVMCEWADVLKPHLTSLCYAQGSTFPNQTN